jgi:tRNA (guanine37-N1)-methyltransferase
MKFNIITLFPEMFPGPLGFSLQGKAKDKSWSMDVHNLRDYGLGRHKSVDDTPYGGGSGMIIRADVIGAAIQDVQSKEKIDKIIFPSPRGKVFKQATAVDLTNYKSILFLCGRYEGIDQRVIERFSIEEYSLGDYIVSGGELPTMMIIDSILRLLPGVIKNDEVHQQESFYNNKFTQANILEHSHYTRPETWEGMKVPEVLSKGNHKEIEKFRSADALSYTRRNRPDLI